MDSRQPDLAFGHLALFDVTMDSNGMHRDVREVEQIGHLPVSFGLHSEHATCPFMHCIKILQMRNATCLYYWSLNSVGSLIYY